MAIDRVAIAKAAQDTGTISAGRGLKVAQVTEFYELAKNEPTLVRDLTPQYMTAPTEPVASLEFTGRITRSAEEATAFTSSERGRMTASGKDLVAKKIRCEVEITDEFRKDNIMGMSVDNYLRGKMAAQFALDWQDLLVLGDTESSDALLSRFDGIIKQIEDVGTGVFDLSSADMSVTDDLLWYLWTKLANKYRRDKKSLRIYANDNMISAYKQWFGKRETSAGDNVVINGEEMTRFNGVRFYDVCSMPDGYLLLTSYKNIRPGLWLDVTPYYWEYPPGGYALVGLDLRGDVKIIEDDLAVLAKGLNIAGMTTA